jgi:hypothetical protein
MSRSHPSLNVIRRMAASSVILLVLLGAGGCASVAPATMAPGVAAQAWIRSELYFGLGRADARDAEADARWARFLDEDVTPRFPQGLTVLDAYGQWRHSRDGGIERLHSKVLVVLHPDDASSRANLQALRDAWKRLSGDESVLWTQQPATVAF